MACGRPVVASDWDGYKELIVHGETGFKVRTDWADCLGELNQLAPVLYGDQEHLHVGQSVSVDMRQMVGYLRDGRFEIDNNLVENAIRPTAIGKKNWLFIGDAAAGERAAIIYTLVESCRRHGIDCYEYLREVFERLPSTTNWQVKDLTPAAWSAARRAKSPMLM